MRGNVYLTHSFISISSHDIFLEYSILHEENKSCVVFKYTREFTKQGNSNGSGIKQKD